MGVTTHHDNINQQFSPQAQAYLQSTVHASGSDLERLALRLDELRPDTVLDMGCGAGHVSFIAASVASRVMAYDLSGQMLDVVEQTAQQRQLNNITTQRGYAESLPFASNRFSLVVSRYSAHHWQDVELALREVRRVLQPGGIFLLLDIISPGQPLTDIWLQTIEALRDTSHVRNYASGEWLAMINHAGLLTRSVQTDRIALKFPDWVARMRTPKIMSDAIRLYQQSASDEVQQHFALQADGSFTSDAIMIEAHKA